jgi:hypothetical protein
MVQAATERATAPSDHSGVPPLGQGGTRFRWKTSAEAAAPRNARQERVRALGHGGKDDRVFTNAHRFVGLIH